MRTSVPPASNTIASIAGFAGLPVSRPVAARTLAAPRSSMDDLASRQHEAPSLAEHERAAPDAPRLGEHAPDGRRVERVLGRMHAGGGRGERVAVAHRT